MDFPHVIYWFATGRQLMSCTNVSLHKKALSITYYYQWPTTVSRHKSTQSLPESNIIFLSVSLLLVPWWQNDRRLFLKDVTSWGGGMEGGEGGCHQGSNQNRTRLSVRALWNYRNKLRSCCVSSTGESLQRQASGRLLSWGSVRFSHHKD